MKIKILNHAASLLMMFLFASLIIQSCKKGKDTPANSTSNSQYYCTANINGAAWKADRVLAGDTSNIMIALAIKIANSDTSLFTIVFPNNIAVNQLTTFDQAQYSLLIFAMQTANGGATNIYSMDPSAGGSGSFTITKMDVSSKVVEGTFNGEAVNTTNNNDKVTITNGKFNMPYIVGRPTNKI
jgi:hypothetical protein